MFAGNFAKGSAGGGGGGGFTPASLPNLLAWLDPTGNATYSGSTLTAAGNAGSKGGNFTVNGTIAKITSGSLSLITMDNVSKRLDLSMTTFSGFLTVFAAGKQIVGMGPSAILGMGWPNDATAKSFYFNGGDTNVYGFGNGCCDIPTKIPALKAVGAAISDTNFHTMLWQLGTTDLLLKDNVSQAITGGSNQSSTGAMPATGTVTWNFGVANPGSEHANSSLATIMIINGALTGTEQTDLHNYYVSRA